MGEDERIIIKCLTENFKYPVKLEWRKYLNDKVKPGEVILDISDLNSSKVVTKVKSICHGRIASCLTPKICEVISIKEQSGEDEKISEFEINDSKNDNAEKSKLYIKQENPNSHNNRYYFGYYLCDHTTFLSNICVECGFILQGKSEFCSNNNNKTIKKFGAGNNNGETAELDSTNRNRHDHKAGNYHENDRNERMLINAGFLSNSNDIKFNRNYVDKQEKSFIFELLYIKRKLSLVLDLDNTLIHASSNLPEIKRREEFVQIKDIMENEITEEIYNKYYGSVVMLGSKSQNTELLPKGIDSFPHYSNEADSTIEIYFKLLESLIFCIPFGSSLNSGIEKQPRNSSNWSFGYYKLRPGVINMLRTLSKDKYEIYMYTMGTEYHAYTSLRILDPELRFFHSKRIFYRNNGFKETSIKSLNTLFPYDHRTLVILDDIEQAWTDINSLLKVYPYNFFPSNSIPNDSSSFSRYISQIRTNNKWSQLIKKKRTRNDQVSEIDCKEKNDTDQYKADKEISKDQCCIDIIKEIINSEKDRQLLIFQKLLIAIHDAYFKEFDSALSTKGEFYEEDSLIQIIYREAPNISNIIKIMRRGVLKDCILQFTGFNNKFFYNFVDSDLYKWCRYFGSSILDNNIKNGSEKLLATHCICEQLYTEKYHYAKENGIPCINILWLETIIYTWISPFNINLNNPLLGDPVNSDYYSPFETLNFTDKKSPNYFDFENYSYSYLYATNTCESLKEQLWEEAFNDISFSMGEEENDMDDDNDESLSISDSSNSNHSSSSDEIPK
ncbi:RNA pol II carboxy terminal domain phosphatase of the HAD superfamily [Cryptosporidium sp. chipmunk genotype I]|uniref:RNA pol II carboxy terminal domain phosphatase of the HAD superfamily n=1 Tax=Cryptosporidium sp. chipmunk genotype I TaxID=1280935 RepID=UPI00351A3683|nr:RNA pol II carboxy terminal domain phosphatase of the HAD superfamily [Cryptosporidium sp. chipmunk genotype I]